MESKEKELTPIQFADIIRKPKPQECPVKAHVVYGDVIGELGELKKEQKPKPL